MSAMGPHHRWNKNDASGLLMASPSWKEGEVETALLILILPSQFRRFVLFCPA